MKTKRTPSPDRESFIERLKEAIAKAGGVPALSQKTGISITALRNYLRCGEPSRPALLLIARTTGVSFEWLATGGAPSTNDAPALCINPVDGIILQRIRNLIKEKLANPQSEKSLRAALSKSAIEDLGSGKRFPYPHEWALLINYYPAQLLFSNEPFTETPYQIVREGVKKLGSKHETVKRMIHAEELSRDIISDLEQVMRKDFLSYRVTNDAMAPKILPGEIVIADPSISIENDNFTTYLVRDGNQRFVAYAALDLARGIVRLSFENQRIAPLEKRYKADPPEIEILGKAIKKFSISGLSST